MRRIEKIMAFVKAFDSAPDLSMLLWVEKR
jgi:hypothetical protein